MHNWASADISIDHAKGSKHQELGALCLRFGGIGVFSSPTPFPVLAKSMKCRPLAFLPPGCPHKRFFVKAADLCGHATRGTLRCQLVLRPKACSDVAAAARNYRLSLNSTADQSQRLRSSCLFREISSRICLLTSSRDSGRDERHQEFNRLIQLIRIVCIRISQVVTVRVDVVRQPLVQVSEKPHRCALPPASLDPSINSAHNLKWERRERTVPNPCECRAARKCKAQARGLILAGSAAGIVFAHPGVGPPYEACTNGLVLRAVILAGLVSLGPLVNYTYFGVAKETISFAAEWPLVLACGVIGGTDSALEYAPAAAAQKSPGGRCQSRLW